MLPIFNLYNDNDIPLIRNIQKGTFCTQIQMPIDGIDLQGTLGQKSTFEPKFNINTVHADGYKLSGESKPSKGSKFTHKSDNTTINFTRTRRKVIYNRNLADNPQNSHDIHSSKPIYSMRSDEPMELEVNHTLEKEVNFLY